MGVEIEQPASSSAALEKKSSRSSTPPKRATLSRSFGSLCWLAGWIEESCRERSSSRAKETLFLVVSKEGKKEDRARVRT